LPPSKGGLKLLIKYVLQKILGYQRYLKWFSAYKIKGLHKDQKENDFFTFIALIPKDKQGFILDIGANLGVMTVHLSRNFPKANIIAIEPVSSNFNVLQHNLSKHKTGNVKALQLAVGDVAGEAVMVLPKDGAVKQHGLCHMEEVSEQHVDGIRHTVKVLPLDEISEIGSPVLGIKIDVENYEYKTLLGARNMLSRDKPVVYAELWENQNRQDTLEFMQSIGYNVHCVEDAKVVLYDTVKHRTQNFIFLPQ
jgi:FkbM family methyltransferase